MFLADASLPTNLNIPHANVFLLRLYFGKGDGNENEWYFESSALMHFLNCHIYTESNKYNELLNLRISSPIVPQTVNYNLTDVLLRSRTKCQRQQIMIVQSVCMPFKNSRLSDGKFSVDF